MNQGDLFQQDWHNCLQAHYEHVIREQDALNERSLITVLNEIGYSMADITAMRHEIVARLGLPEPVEEAPVVEEIVDEMVLTEAEETQIVAENVSAEPVEAVAVTEPEVSAEIETAAEDASQAVQEVEPSEPPEPPEAPTVQMSLF